MRWNIRGWFTDQGFRKLWKNAGILLTGNVATAGLDLVSLALTGRALGPSQFGMLVLIHTYVVVVDTIINFQSWQAVIKYGADAQAKGGQLQFKSLIKFCTCLDAFSAVFGTLVALGGVYWMAEWQQWEDETSKMALAYCMVILFTLSSTPTAVLRLFDKFHWYAWQRVAIAALKLCAIAIAFLLGEGLWTFLLIWMAMLVLGHLAILVLGWLTLRMENYDGVLRAPLRGVTGQNPGIWQFVASTNLSSSIRLGAQEVDVLIVGGVLDSAAAGIYKVAKQFGSIPTRFGDPLQQSIYPSMAKLWAEDKIDQFRNYIFRISAISGAGGIALWFVFLICGDWILKITVGSEFGEAYKLLVVYMIGYVLYLFGITFRPAILSMLHPERILYIYILAHVVYFGVLFILLERIGVLGAAVAQTVFHGCWFILMLLSIFQYLNFAERVQHTQELQ